MANKNLSDYSNEKVLQFYKELPFNYYSNVEEQSKNILLGERNFEIYGPLVKELKIADTIIDVGCGAGYLTNSISYVYPLKKVLGIDFNSIATDRAIEVSKYLKLNSNFKAIDLFKYIDLPRFDLAISIGVLMHTNNFFEGLKHIIKEMINKNGKIYIGLYNIYGRKPFLDHFESLKLKFKNLKKSDLENTLFEEYKKIDQRDLEQTHLKSWFRDQVLHPKETQHTLSEIVPIIEPEYKIISTSLNKFEQIKNLDEILNEEEKWYDFGLNKLRNNIYFPGFFIVCCERVLQP